MRQRLLLATLKSTPVLIEDINAHDTLPALRSHEISLLRLFEKLTDDCLIEINQTGTKSKYKPGIIVGGSSTKSKYKPGIIVGGSNLVHDCLVSRAIGYFLEPLILLGLFAWKPLIIILKGQNCQNRRVDASDMATSNNCSTSYGITNDSKDPSVDPFCSVTFPMLKHFGVPSEGLELEIKSHGVSPNGGGEVHLMIPTVQHLTMSNDVELMREWLRGSWGKLSLPE